MVELTLEQAKEFLAAAGIALPDPLLQALVNKVNSVDACLEGAGYSDDDIILIKYYALGMFASLQGDGYITSQRAPNGAARSFRYMEAIDKYRGWSSLLSGLDTSGCMTAIVPPYPGKKAGIIAIGVASCCR